MSELCCHASYGEINTQHSLAALNALPYGVSGPALEL
jgi:hypothetical protein